MTRRRVGAALTAMACIALLAGCGSMVAFPAAGSSGGEAGLAAGGSASSGTAGGNRSATTAGTGTGTGGTGGLVNSSGASGSGGLANGSGPGSTGSGGAGPSGGSGGLSGSRPGSGVTTASHVPGVTATTISIGFPIEVDGAAANEALGANGITQGDQQAEAQAIIDQMNKEGGILGRKIVPVWYDLDALSTASYDSQYQAMCDAFEDDSHVFAIMTGGNAVVQQCAQQAGGVSLWEDLSVASAHTFAQYPSYFEVGMLDLNRIVLNEAAALDAQGYFSPWNATLSEPGTAGTKPTVGVITYDTSDFEYAIDDVLNPQLARMGYAVSGSNEVYVNYPQSQADLSTDSSQEASAVLKFRTEGVDHVLILDDSGDLTLEFLNEAESQHYFPRYGFNSQNGPEALESPGDVPAAQLNGSMGIGWDPIIDLTSADDPDNGPYSNAARRACVALMSANGITFSDPNAEAVALAACDQFAFLKAAITAGGPTIDQASFVAGVNKLGYWSDDGETFGDYFGAGQHDGGAYYRDYQWNGSCRCMDYTGGNEVAVGEGES